jgi:hypothetical protein
MAMLVESRARPESITQRVPCGLLTRLGLSRQTFPFGGQLKIFLSDAQLRLCVLGLLPAILCLRPVVLRGTDLFAVPAVVD